MVKFMAERFKLNSAVYVIFEKEDKVLLQLRQNTGYKDGMYGLVQGHLEQHEEIVQAACREIREETGVEVVPDNLELRIIGHNELDLPYIDFVFVCKTWQGEHRIGEPDKCKSLTWFEKNKLPKNTMPLIVKYLKLAETAGFQLAEIKG